MEKPTVFPANCPACGKLLKSAQAWGGHLQFCPGNKGSPETKSYISNIKKLRLQITPTIRDRESRMVKNPGETLEFTPDEKQGVGRFQTNSRRIQAFIESLKEFCGKMGSGQMRKYGGEVMIWEE